MDRLVCAWARVGGIGTGTGVMNVPPAIHLHCQILIDVSTLPVAAILPFMSKQLMK
mgnify:CR=1 FL=1